ncbi:MAG: GspH/FimT family pseudopilin [Magnetococcales bacterium]|nr:GspH/FimT family pseudopilin [Magnetococcales bacterium]
MKVNSGFTLLELLIVIAIAFVLISLAVPTFSLIIKDNRMIVRVNNFIGLTSYARSEAVKRSSRITICPSTTGTTCLTTGTWESGWAIFVDADDSGTLNTGDTLLKVNAGVTGNDITIRGSANIQSYISYNANGLIRKIDGSLQSGSMVFCDDRGAGTDARTVTISAVGRLSTTTGALSCTP